MNDHLNFQSGETPEALLVWFFKRNGCFRKPNEERRLELGLKYKKGYEVRFVAHNESELIRIRELLELVGLKAGQPYRKSRQFVQPVYGKRAVDWFSNLVLSKET